MIRELTQEQIASGWVQITSWHNAGVALSGLSPADYMIRYVDDVWAYRILSVDANADMLARDLPRDPKPAPPLKWPTPWQPAQNLTRVAPIGFRAWGEQ